MDEFDIVILGAGPGGYVAAIRSAQLGMKTAVVEKDAVGGICLNWGCIPSKALLKNAEILSMVKRADEFGIYFDNLRVDFKKTIERSRNVVDRLTRGVGYLLKKHKVDLIKGEGLLSTSGTVNVSENRTLKAKNIILATGARPRSIPALPLDGDRILTSRDALELKTLPASVAIVGGGATGAEFAYLYNSFGVKVTLIELLPHLLPNEDKETSVELEKSFANQGINIMTDSTVKSFSRQGTMNTVTVVQNAEKEVSVECEKVLACIGVQANSDNLGLETLGVEMERGFVKVDENMATNVPGIYAIGDLTGKMLLAHVASAQGVNVIETIAGMEPQPLDYINIPRATYCHPQVASFGLTEDQVVDQGIKYKIGRFPFQASGKALAIGETEGQIKLILGSEHGELLGAHLVGPDVTELLAEISMTHLLEGTASELGLMIHSHPTLSETLKEAALDANGEAIHV